ncbi:MAG: sugar porter family MFS transporter [Patescibacteria group bacterium]|nr:sugar porter family MFS transporter [Patescibacteria group bacterium]
MTSPMSPLRPPTPTSARGSAPFLAAVCLVASLGGLLFGFDTAVISGTVERVAEQYALTHVMQGWFTSSALLGCIVGAAVAGMLGDRFGRKPVLIVSAFCFFVSALYSTIPPTFTILVLARMLGGLGVGMASVLAPMYIAEFAPPRLRGRLVALYQLSIVLGILAAYCSNWCLVEYSAARPDAFGNEGMLHRVLVAEVWRAMFGAEMLPASLFLLLLLFVPESPRWLAKEGRNDAAVAILSRVGGREVAQRQMAEIQASLDHEEGTWAELFKPGLRTALLVGVMLSVFGQLSGVNIVVYYGPKILATAGYDDVASLLGQVGFGLINLVFTIVALLVIDRWGRRPLLLGGMAGVTVVLAVIGGLFLAGDAEGAMAGGAVSKTLGLWIGVMICVYMACIALSICAVIWVLTPEIFPNRVRGRGVSIATLANWSTNAFSAFAFPWYVAHFGMYTGFFTSAAICLVATVFFWRFVPETKGKTLEEIERHWLPAR